MILPKWSTLVGILTQLCSTESLTWLNRKQLESFLLGRAKRHFYHCTLVWMALGSARKLNVIKRWLIRGSMPGLTTPGVGLFTSGVLCIRTSKLRKKVGVLFVLFLLLLFNPEVLNPTVYFTLLIFISPSTLGANISSSCLFWRALWPSHSSS